MPQSGFTAFLRRSLDALERDTPDVARRLAAALADLVIALWVDDEAVLVRVAGGRVVCDPAEGAASVQVRTGRATLLALIDGARTLHDAVLSDAVQLRGGPEDLARFQDALWLYLQGAVRAPSMPEILGSFRAAS